MSNYRTLDLQTKVSWKSILKILGLSYLVFSGYFSWSILSCILKILILEYLILYLQDTFSKYLAHHWAELCWRPVKKNRQTGRWTDTQTGTERS